MFSIVNLGYIPNGISLVYFFFLDIGCHLTKPRRTYNSIIILIKQLHHYCACIDTVLLVKLKLLKIFNLEIQDRHDEICTTKLVSFSSY